SLFQRTAQWIAPLMQGPIPEEQKALFRARPDLLESEYRRISDENNSKFAAAIVGANPRAYTKLVQFCRDYLETSVHDPELRAKPTPDYAVACKPLILSETFYHALQRPNAELVTDPID